MAKRRWAVASGTKANGARGACLVGPVVWGEDCEWSDLGVESDVGARGRE